MTKKESVISVEGVVLKVLPGTNFEVELEGGHKIRAHVSGKMRMHFVKLMVGDRVSVEMNAYDLSKGRVVFRHKN